MNDKSLEQQLREAEDGPSLEQQLESAQCLANVDNAKQLIEAIASGEHHIAAASGTYLIEKDLEIPPDVTLELLGGEFLFSSDTGLIVRGCLKDRDEERVTFDAQREKWKNIVLVDGQVRLNAVTLQNGTGRGENFPSQENDSESYFTAGGLIHQRGGHLHLGADSIVRGGYAHNGGGVCISRGISRLGGVITQNEAKFFGGGVKIRHGILNLSGLVHENKAETGGGLAIYVSRPKNHFVNYPPLQKIEVKSANRSYNVEVDYERARICFNEPKNIYDGRKKP